MNSASDKNVESSFEAQPSELLPMPLLAFQPEVGMLDIQARAGDSLIVISSVQQVATSVAHYQTLLENGGAVSCRKPLEILVGAPAAGGPSRHDAKDLASSKVESDGSADDVDHGSPFRMRAVLRTLFQVAEPDVGCSHKNPKIENEAAVEIDDSGDFGCQDIPSKTVGAVASAVTHKLDGIAMGAEKNGNEEIIILNLKDGRSFREEPGSVELDNDSSHTDRETLAGTETQKEDLVVETSVHLTNFTLAHMDEEKISSSQEVTSPAKTPNSYTKPLTVSAPFEFTGLNHVAFCCENLEKTLEFYCGLLGLKASPDRPNLPYRGAWLLLGKDGIHIMEVPNPDPVHGRPQHGGWDRHACLNCRNVESLRKTLDNAEIPYQLSMVPSIFCRDPDGNGLEFIEISS